MFRQGALSALTKPKGLLFFTAFLPQFIDPHHGSIALQAAVLGTIFVGFAVISDSGYALAAAGLSDRIRASARARRARRLVSGTIFLSLGAVAALAKRA